MNQKKVELLAPAGDFSCFQAAINAGADAVYLGGDKFGARAYANNFSQDEIIEALRIAHLFQKKIYLTVNTLVKEKELNELVPYITPLYEAGLDGVIIQDMGVLLQLRRHFPKLELHASTQMTVTGVYGAEFLKKQGVCRVVPARELSLEEIKEIKVKTGLAIETFIHGAMCYAYSGQCLFSSILGGRSGNRGRCAGPCRLPYTDEKGHIVYPLSLKDMYTLPIIPKLIEAGIDSFKIEGRMKSPEYVAGVTAMYRKYIDAYLSAPDKPFKVSAEDEAILKGLYIRTDICQGYYEQHNGKNMVTLSEPGYSGNREEVLNDIRNRYLAVKKTIPVHGVVTVKAGMPMKMQLSCDKYSLTAEAIGAEAGAAINRPLTADDIRNRMSKMGDTYFTITQLEVITDEQSFAPVKDLNKLRRQVCAELESKLLQANASRQDILYTASMETRKLDSTEQNSSLLYASVNTTEQLKAVLKQDFISGIYINSDLFLISVDCDWILDSIGKQPQKQYFIALPYILRKRSCDLLEQIHRLIESTIISGVLVRNIEELEWLVNIDYKGQIIADYTIYAWNHEALGFYQQYFHRHTMPLELNRKELSALEQTAYMPSCEISIYGRIPLMFSANCVRKTLSACSHKADAPYDLTDRYHNHFPVAQNCVHCYNILYNTLPLSLHNQLEKLMAENYGVYRLDFTLEDAAQTEQILDYYGKAVTGDYTQPFPVKEYTTGHYKRGVE